MNLKLIETWLPLEALAQAAANEARAGKGTPAALHLWWGSRQATVARGLLFAQLVDAPGLNETAKLRELHDVLVGLLNGDELVESRARELVAESCGDVWPTVHDPFCGVGTIPFAALSLGLPAAGGDLNPVAAFVSRLAIGPTRSGLEPADVRRAIAWVDAEVKAKVAANYPGVWVTAAMAADRPDLAPYVGKVLPVEMYLWVRTVPDPNPAYSSVAVPLCTNFVTGAKAGRETWVEPVLLKGRPGYRFRIHAGTPTAGCEDGTRVGRAGFRSIFDGKTISAEYVQEQARQGRLGVRLMAVFATGADGEHVVLPATDRQERIVRGIPADALAPQLPLPENPRDCTPAHYGVHRYGDLFLPRQQTALAAVSRAIAAYAAKGEKERAAARVLTLAFSTFVSWHSTANTYWNQRQFPRNVFVRQKINQTWDFVEANPVANSLKRWDVVANTVADRFFELRRVPVGTAVQADACAWRAAEPVVFNTELPYYDNVAYADLADFFYGWIRPCLQATDPDLAQSMASPRTEELTALAYRHGGREQADRFYRTGVARALANMARQQRTDYPAVFSFDFRSAFLSGRDLAPLQAFVEGLVGAGFVITATWPLKDVREKAVFGGNAGTGFRSLYFVCRPGCVRREPIARRRFVEILREQLVGGLDLYRTLDRDLSAADFAPAAVGVGIRIYSQYEGVLTADGSAFTAREAVEEVLRLVERIRAEEREGSRGTDAAAACAAFRAQLKAGVDPDALYQKVYAAYDKAESEGRDEDARIYNELLNQWNELLEEDR